MNPSLSSVEQSVNNIIMLRQFVVSVRPIYDALSDARSTLLTEIRQVIESSKSLSCLTTNQTVAMRTNERGSSAKPY